MYFSSMFRNCEGRQLGFRSKALAFSLVALFFTLCNAPANAGVMYNLVDRGASVAQLMLSDLPASVGDIESLTFTGFGNDEGFFDIGEEFDGSFSVDMDNMGFQIISFVDPVLGPGLATNKPPPPNGEELIIEGQSTGKDDLLMLAFTDTTFGGMSYQDEMGDEVLVLGNWLRAAPIPEPSSITLWCCLTAVGIGGNLRRRRKQLS